MLVSDSKDCRDDHFRGEVTRHEQVEERTGHHQDGGDQDPFHHPPKIGACILPLVRHSFQTSQ